MPIASLEPSGEVFYFRKEMAKNAFPKVLHNQEIMKKFGDPDWAYAKLGEAYEELLFSKLTNSELFNNYFISR